MSRLLAFLRRDWLIRSSYRTAFAVTLAHIVFTVASFFFISRLVDSRPSPTLAPYGGAYFPFVVLGLAFSRYLTASLSSFAGSMREEQLQGTLESILTTPTSPLTVVLGGAAWELLWTTVEVIVYVGLGVFVFGMDLSLMNIPAGLVVLGLLILSLSSLGVLSVSGILLFKEFDPVTWLLGGLMRLVSGVYFPLVLLPGWLQAVAAWLPLTYGLEGLRQAVLLGRPLAELGRVCLALGAFAVVGWAVALAAFSWTLNRLKRTGALSFR
ncbi:MAG: ABC transporter permease [Candidatus Omnitrophica bacterium]|nr:ABC transporter permease [Candidatus Omnitrophota bacterium]